MVEVLVDHKLYPIFKDVKQHNASLVLTSPFQNRMNCFRLFCFHEFQKGYPAGNTINGVICECGHQDGHHDVGCDGSIIHISITGRKRISHCGCMIRYFQLHSNSQGS